MCCDCYDESEPEAKEAIDEFLTAYERVDLEGSTRPSLVDPEPAHRAIIALSTILQDLVISTKAAAEDAQRKAEVQFLANREISAECARLKDFAEWVLTLDSYSGPEPLTIDLARKRAHDALYPALANRTPSRPPEPKDLEALKAAAARGNLKLKGNRDV